MNTPDFSEDVAGVDDLTAADLESLGIPTDGLYHAERLGAGTGIAPSKSYIRWKPIAEAFEKEAIFWRTALIYLAVLWILTTAALVVAVTVT